MPEGARPLSVQVQDEKACLWAIVDETSSIVRQHFAVVGTGHDLPANVAEWVFLDTFQTRGGFVFHVFEVPAPCGN
jgi:hypothetical protein